jgi:CBS domain-containing protein
MRQFLRRLLTHSFLFLKSIQTSGEKIVLNAKSPAHQIMVSIDKLVTARRDAKFSEVFFKVNGLGVSYIPILDDNDQCIKILSRRDLVKRIPPARIPEDVALQYGINRGKIVRKIAELGNKKIQDLFPAKQNIVSVKASDTIDMVIDILTQRHEIGDNYRYISGLPVFVDESQELEGFISFRDVIQYFISTQKDFLKTYVRDVATLPTDYEEIIRMTDNDDLSFADSLLQAGVRSIPVVKGSYDSHELWGFVDEIKVNIYNHDEFTNNLATLECKHFAIDARTLDRRGYIITPNETLAACLSKFWVREEGQIPPASFVVAERGEEAEKFELLGILSYVDILKAWKKWNSK